MPLPSRHSRQSSANRMRWAGIVLGGGLFLQGLASPVAYAYNNILSPIGNPISYEARYAEDLKQTIHVNRQVDINQASLNQLTVLPGFDMNLALKVIRHRPFMDMDDLVQRMPVSSQHRLLVIRNRLAGAIRF